MHQQQISDGVALGLWKFVLGAAILFGFLYLVVIAGQTYGWLAGVAVFFLPAVCGRLWRAVS